MKKDQSFNQSEFLDLLPEIVFEIDKELNIKFLNQACEKILGFSKSELINNKAFLKDFIVPVDIERINNDINKNLNGIHVSGNSYRFFNKAKEELILEIYNSHIKKNGKVVGLRCIAIDITEKEKNYITLTKSEQRLQELNATKDKFFSIIAHDLKNPFNDLMGFTQLLALNIEKYDKSKIEQFVNIIHQSSKLAYNLLENLLDWSRSQTGILKFNPEKIPINKLVDENIDLLESTARNKNIQIYSEFDKGLFAFADKNMVRTIIRNLISNAIKYTNQGGHINIKSYSNNKVCEISVSDSGIGISEENIAKIFVIDKSFSTTGTEREKGTGLGLILCKEFVEKNGGKLWVKSKPNKGSTFFFTLPLPELEF